MGLFPETVSHGQVLNQEKVSDELREGHASLHKFECALIGTYRLQPCHQYHFLSLLPITNYIQILRGDS